jgi:PAS domain S-box-containing protein
VENIDREVAEERAQAVLNIGHAQRRILLILPISAVLTLLFAAFLGSAITRSITQPLRRLMEGSAALASGDFSHRVPAAGKDEIARLGNVFNAMVVRLQELYRELQRREIYLAEAQRLSHTGSFGWDVSSGEIYWSPETFRIFEYEPRAKATIDLVVQRIHPEDRLVVQQLIERVSRERTEFDFEHRLLMPDGSVKYLHVVGHPSTDESGRFEFVGAVTDITESKRAEEALRRSGEQLTRQKAQLDELFEQAPEAVVLLDVQDRVLRINPEFTRIFGYASDEAIGRPINDLVAPEELRSEAEEYTYRITHGMPLNAETIRRRKDGRRIHVSLLAVPISVPRGQIGEYAIYRDITERKRAEEALRRSEGYLTEAQRLTRSGSWAWDVRTRTIFWSQEVFRIYEFDPEQMKPTWPTFLERIHPEDRPAVEQRAKMESTQKELVNSEADFRIVLPDGRIKHLHTIAHPVMDDSDEITEVVGTVMDVTEQREARAALERSEGYLAEAQRLTRTGSWALNARTRDLFWSQEMFRILDYPATIKPSMAHFF